MTKHETPDGAATALIHRTMNGVAWSADTLDEIARIVRATGREIEDPKPDGCIDCCDGNVVCETCDECGERHCSTCTPCDSDTETKE